MTLKVTLDSMSNSPFSLKKARDNLINESNIISEVIWSFSGSPSISGRGRSRGRVQGCTQPRWDEAFFKFCFKICLPHRSVTSFLRGAPPPKKNPGSAPALSAQRLAYGSMPLELAETRPRSNFPESRNAFSKIRSAKLNTDVKILMPGTDST